MTLASRIIAYSRTLADMMVFVSVGGCTEEISTPDEVKVSEEVCYHLPVLSNDLYDIGSEKREYFAQIPNFGFKTLITLKL